MRQPRNALVAMALTLALGAPAAAAPPAPAEPVDWRDQIIYFVMIDRFDDGDPRNNDQGQGEYDPADRRKFSGGDLAGVTRRLDYIRGLGATAVWITPPVANQWWSQRSQYGGYHGYWASDFKAVDAHFGTLADYRALADGLHRRDMRLVQDVVVNHMGDWFGWPGAWNPDDPAQGVELRRDGGGRTAPAQAPFDRNDVRTPGDRAAAIYHWTPTIRDFTDPAQEHTFALADLDDLNTENPTVRRALRDSYGYWIREVGVDAFRIDTAFYVPPQYFRDFLYADDPAAPGVLQVAREAGKPAFHVFGEGWGIDRPYEDVQARKIEGYVRDAEGPLLPGMINFTLYGTLADVFARGRPAAELGDRITRVMQVHANPWLMPTFVDNHDVDRFLSGGDEAGLRQALLAIMTLPGIPTLYYGTEQGFRQPREAMFGAGYGGGGRDRFDTASPLYRYVAEVTALRRAHTVFSRGTPTVLAANAASPGLVAWRMQHEGETALVLFNTASAPILADHVPTGLAPGTRLAPLYALAGTAPRPQVGADGALTLTMPPRSAFVFATDGAGAPPPAPKARVALAPLDREVQPGDLQVMGDARGLDVVQVVVDGDLDRAVTAPVERDGRWRARVRTDDMVDPSRPHRVVAYDPRSGAVSEARTFRVDRAWTLVAEAGDPRGDDAGPTGTYAYPDDPVYRAARPADLLGGRVSTTGGALRLSLRLGEIRTDWNPANGFDHVAFTVYISLPGQTGGTAVMPQQDGVLPDGMPWHRRLRAHGWSNVMTTADGADAQSEGTVLPVAPVLEVDRANATVTFTFPAGTLGVHDLAGARVHVTTWDYDGGYRPVRAEGGMHAFGGAPAGSPKVMDAMTFEVPRVSPRSGD